MQIEWSEGPASRCVGSVRWSTADDTTRWETGYLSFWQVINSLHILGAINQRMVGNPYLGIISGYPSSESNPQFSAQVGTPTPTDTAARSCGTRARVAPIATSSFARIWSRAPVPACNSSNPALRQVQFPRLGQQSFAKLTVGLLFHEAESCFLVNMTSCRENALSP